MVVKVVLSVSLFFHLCHDKCREERSGFCSIHVGKVLLLQCEEDK